MLILPVDWDGFGTSPICDKVHNIATQMLNFLPESLFGLQIFVGVNNEGSLYLEFDLNRKTVEMTILEDGTIHYDEIIAGVIVGSGSFLLTKEHLNRIVAG